MSNCKKVASFIYLNNETVKEDLIRMCQTYSDNGADLLVLIDNSRSEEEHHKVVDLVKEVAKHPVAPHCLWRFYLSY
ncbi:hypothetical protein P261_02864 [Lachnospiraceae bacterium TWA4]|nr:hypothetical protein P261_02864 [Lachnospiraceae bacterium TWA4]